jgi:hypothetical protein
MTCAARSRPAFKRDRLRRVHALASIDIPYPKDEQMAGL